MTRPLAILSLPPAGIGPATSSVTELYGTFAATELITYEEMGFFPEKAGAAVGRGRHLRPVAAAP